MRELIYNGFSSKVNRVEFCQGKFKGFSQGAAIVMRQALPEDEIKVLLTLDHPNIVRFLGYVGDGFFPILITELAHDGSLRDYLQKTKSRPSHQKLKRWVGEITSAVRYLHGGVTGVKPNSVRLVKHCGISTRRCFIFRCDGGNILKLSDPGSRHTTSKTTECSSL